MSDHSTDYSAAKHEATVQQIDRVPTIDQPLPAKDHEKLYLSPENAVKGQLRKTFGNPTPVALAGFLLANTPASCDLMGWRGAGGHSGNAASGTASYYFFGGMLLLAGGIGEWVLGNTFPSVVFFTFSGFWFTFGGTLTPYYAAVSSYTTTLPDGTTKADPEAFFASFAFFLVFMGVLCFIYMVCALRTNICLVAILGLFVLAFGFLSASYFYAAQGMVAISGHMTVGGGACAFAASLVAWWLWTSMMFESVDFPISIPVGDLSTHFLGKHDREKARMARAGDV